jgi:hypothetical protein
MKGYGGVTTNDRFAFLSEQPGIDEAHFWQSEGNSVFQSVDPLKKYL